MEDKLFITLPQSIVDMVKNSEDNSICLSISQYAELKEALSNKIRITSIQDGDNYYKEI